MIPEKIGLLLAIIKRLPNEVGGMDTALPEEVADKMKASADGVQRQRRKDL